MAAGRRFGGPRVLLELRVGWRLPDTYAFSNLVGADDNLAGTPRRTFAFVFLGGRGRLERLLITFRVFFVRDTDIFSPENDFAALTVRYVF